MVITRLDSCAAPAYVTATAQGLSMCGECYGHGSFVHGHWGGGTSAGYVDVSVPGGLSAFSSCQSVEFDYDVQDWLYSHNMPPGIYFNLGNLSTQSYDPLQSRHVQLPVADWLAAGGGLRFSLMGPYMGFGGYGAVDFWVGNIVFHCDCDGPTPTFSRTTTPSRTISTTGTPSCTQTPTAYHTYTPTCTPTATLSPTLSSTGTRTVTLTSSPSVTASSTACADCLPTPRPSITPTPTFCGNAAGPLPQVVIRGCAVPDEGLSSTSSWSYPGCEFWYDGNEARGHVTNTSFYYPVAIRLNGGPKDLSNCHAIQVQRDLNWSMWGYRPVDELAKLSVPGGPQVSLSDYGQGWVPLADLGPYDWSKFSGIDFWINDPGTLYTQTRIDFSLGPITFDCGCAAPTHTYTRTQTLTVTHSPTPTATRTTTPTATRTPGGFVSGPVPVSMLDACSLPLDLPATALAYSACGECGGVGAQAYGHTEMGGSIVITLDEGPRDFSHCQSVEIAYKASSSYPLGVLSWATFGGRYLYPYGQATAPWMSTDTAVIPLADLGGPAAWSSVASFTYRIDPYYSSGPLYFGVDSIKFHCDCNDPSPTFSRTPTPSATATATFTGPGSCGGAPGTCSPTLSVTGTLTATRTHTASATPTRTTSPTRTATATACAACSPTHSPTISVTFSESPTPSLTRTRSPSPTVTVSPTVSATFSVSPTVTATLTACPACSPTSSPTLTATRTGTRTASPTGTPTITPSASRTATRTMTWTATLSATPSPSLTQAETELPTPEESPTETVTPSLTVSASPSPTQGLTPCGPCVSPTAAPTVQAFEAVAAPNPATGSQALILVDSLDAAPLTLRLYNTLGELLSEVSFNAVVGRQTVSVDISGYAPGLYLYQLYDSRGRSLLPGLASLAIVR